MGGQQIEHHQGCCHVFSLHYDIKVTILENFPLLEKYKSQV